MTDNQHITIISASPRPESNTRKVCAHYIKYARNNHPNISSLDLSDMDADFLFHNQVMGKGNEKVDQWVNEKIKTATHLVFVFPEYNGSFPGILKIFIDGVKPEFFKNKKVGLIGVATGRAGNLRGMDHFQMVMHHLGALVLPINLPLSSIHNLSNENGITDQNTQNALHLHFNKLISF